MSTPVGTQPQGRATFARATKTHLVTVLDAQGLVDLVLDGESVAVPARPARHVVARLVRVPRHRVLDGACTGGAGAGRERRGKVRVRHREHTR